MQNFGGGQIECDTAKNAAQHGMKWNRRNLRLQSLGQELKGWEFLTPPRQ